jgi:predicted ATPase/DNA-binding CsgD family transcriptional regulator
VSIGRLARRPGNLPADVTSFVGRRRELSEARSLLSSSRLLTLTGVGGVGKTRLALRLAGDVGRLFPDGVWLVDLASLRDEELLVSTVAAALGLTDTADRSPLAQLSSYVADKRLLLVLDNCEHLVQGCAMLAGKLLGAAPDLRILTTSREALAIEGEQLYTVPPLSVPDPSAPISAATLSLSEAAHLFVERATAILPDFRVTAGNRAAVVGLCRRLDGIPLALELAAVQVRVLPVEGILQRLDDRFRLLTRGSRAALPRHRTLRAATEWSYELCSPAERVLWARMSVFPGPCDLEAVEQVCSGDGIAVEEVFDLVLGLVAKSIVVRVDGVSRSRYRLLETVREFGNDILAESGEVATLRARHCDYYLRLTSRPGWFGSNEVGWLTRMRLEQPNLRAALEFSLTEPGWGRTGLEIMAKVYYLWVLVGALREGRRWLERALLVNAERTATRAHVMQGYAYLLILLGDIDTALTVLRECRDLGEKLGDASVLAYAALRTGSAKMYQGDAPGALVLLEESLERYRGIDDPMGVYFAVRNLAMAATAVDDPRAESLAWECLRLCEVHGADVARSWALWVIGLTQWRGGAIGPAVARVREALRLKVRMGDLAGQAHCLELLAWASVSADDMARAARLFGAAHRMWRRVGSTLVEYGYIQGFHGPAEERARRALGESFGACFRDGEELDAADAVHFALGERMPHPQDSPAPDAEPLLTPREREIAELVGEGLSNKDIAARLVIAQRTAEGHVQHILAKLGFTSRAQIAAWVVKNDI